MKQVRSGDIRHTGRREEPLRGEKGLTWGPTNRVKNMRH